MDIVALFILHIWFLVAAGTTTVDRQISETIIEVEQNNADPGTYLELSRLYQNALRNRQKMQNEHEMLLQNKTKEIKSLKEELLSVQNAPQSKIPPQPAKENDVVIL